VNLSCITSPTKWNLRINTKKKVSILAIFSLLGLSLFTSSVRAITPPCDEIIIKKRSISVNRFSKPTLINRDCEANVNPQIPAWLQAPSSDNDGTFTITWAAALGANRYTLQQKLANQSDSAYSTVFNGSGLAFNTNGLSDATYQYRIKSCNSSSLSVQCSGYRYSEQVVVKRPPPPPPPAGTIERDVISDAVGSISGSFRVDESGQANYAVPIYTPVGIAGVKPTVSLNYNSGAGNGHMGIGWNISANSSISRCGKSKEVDGEIGAVNLDYEDRFCLDGQKLVLISGTYGHSGSEYRTVVASQTKVIARGTSGKGPSYFEVWRKDGSYNTYGYTSDSRFLSNTNGVVQDTPFAWAQTFSEDRYNNKINYIYNKNESEGEFSIDRIEYSPQVKIQFNYSTGRSDTRRGYSLGGKTLLSQQLESIQVHDDSYEVRKYEFEYQVSQSGMPRLTTIIESKDGVSLKPTVFTWTNAIKGVQPDSNNTNGINFKTGTFINIDGDLQPDWLYVDSDDISLVDPQTGNVVLFGGIKATFVRSYQFNGQEYIKGCSGYVAGDVYDGRNFEVFDLDGDGRDEAILTTHDSLIAVSFEASGCLKPWSQRTLKLTDIDTDKKDWFFGDVNGDGLPDLVYTRNNKAYVKYFEPNSSNYFSNETPAQFVITSVTASGNSWNSQYIETVSVSAEHSSYADFNGDGRIDMMVKVTKTKRISQVYCGDINPRDPICSQNITPTTSHYWMIVAAQGNNVFKELANAGNLGADVTKNKHIRFVDINLDGLPDLVYRNRSDDRWHYKLFTGTHFLASLSLNVDNDDSIYFGDHDQDGLLEIMTIKSGKLKSAEIARNGYIPTYFGDTGIRADVMMAQIDMNADGELDIISVELDEHSTYHNYDNYASFNKTPFVARDKIATIDNGLGSVTNISYKALTDPSQPNLYDEHYGWSYDANGKVVYKLTSPQYVVQKAESSAPAHNNVNNMNSVEYRYGKARAHSVYGSMGFEWLETIDPQSNMITRTTYKQEYPYIGRPAQTETWYGNRSSGRLISKAVSSYAQKNVRSYNKADGTTGQIIFPYLSKTIEDSYDFNALNLVKGSLISRVISTSTYNNYGDPLIQKVYTCFGYQPNCESSGWLKRIQTSNTYLSANESDWILGRLSRVVVNHSSSGQPSISRTSAFEYDSSTGIIIAEIIEPDSSDNTEYLKTKYFHDSHGNVTKTTSCNRLSNCDSVPTSDPFDLYKVHRTSRTEYDYDGRYPTKSYNGYNQLISEVISRNELGQVTKVEDINGYASQNVYGTFGQDYYSSSATGGWSKQIKRLCDSSICPTSAIIRIKSSSADGSWSYAFLDQLGRTVKTTKLGFDGSEINSEIQYDSFGRLYRTSLPYKNSATDYTTNHYDVLGRVYETVYPDDGSGVNRDRIYFDGYDSTEMAIKTRTVNALGQTKTEYKNAAGELVKVVDNAQNILAYKYNAVGDLLDVNLNNVLQSRIEYDSLGRKIKMWDWDKGAQNGKYWQYTYNALGELAYQKDAKNQQVRIYRDRSGRTIRKLDSNSSGVYISDARWNFNNSTAIQNSIGKLTKVWNAKSNDLVIEYYYDTFGRNKETTKIIAGKAFVSDVTYDSIGRVYENFDASGSDNGLRYVYNSHGYLTYIQEAKGSNGKIYRTINEMDMFGNVIKETFGNGVITKKDYYQKTGRLSGITTTKSGAVRQALSYSWDKIGRLQSRASAKHNQTDVFGYDSLNRVKYVNGVNKFNYDAQGNLTWKQFVGSYTYGATCGGVKAGHHAVTKAGSQSYCYDLNGNMTSGDGRTMVYSTFDKATRIQKGSHVTQFAYSPARSRYKRTDSSGTNITTTFYVGGGVEYIQKPNGTTFYRRSIPGAVIEVPSTGSMKVNYLHTDHLGSTDAITNANGTLVQENSFDAFGQKRKPTSWGYRLSNTQFSPLALTSRGYTGHEMADEVGVIHMNGRIYDAKLGRFMQADPMIDGATDSQGYNRYTYVRNNPLAYTDPTGFKRSGGLKNFHKLMKAASYVTGGLIGGYIVNNTKWGKQLYTIAAFAACGPPCGSAATAHVTALKGGNFVQSLEAGARSYATSYITEQVAGDIGGRLDGGLIGLERAAFEHGILGGVIAELQGGKFGHGFASSFLSKYIGVKSGLEEFGGEDLGSKISRIMIAGVIGGTISDVTGGKFANGALQSAMQWAFNSERSSARAGRAIARMIRAGRNTKLPLRERIAAKAAEFVDAGIPAKTAEAWAKRMISGESRASGSMVAKQVRLESAQSLFNSNGGLSKSAIKNSQKIIDSAQLNNTAIPKGYSKYATETVQSPSSGNIKVHFYKHDKTDEVFYGLDFKTIFNEMSGSH
jgi:RHS repeat-associated protein